MGCNTHLPLVLLVPRVDVLYIDSFYNSCSVGGTPLALVFWALFKSPICFVVCSNVHGTMFLPTTTCSDTLCALAVTVAFLTYFNSDLQLLHAVTGSVLYNLRPPASAAIVTGSVLYNLRPPTSAVYVTGSVLYNLRPPTSAVTGSVLYSIINLHLL